MQTTWQGTKRQRCSKKAYHSLLQKGGQKGTWGGGDPALHGSNATVLCGWLLDDEGQTVSVCVVKKGWVQWGRGRLLAPRGGLVRHLSTCVGAVTSRDKWDQNHGGGGYQRVCDFCSFSVNSGHRAALHQRVWKMVTKWKWMHIRQIWGKTLNWHHEAYLHASVLGWGPKPCSGAPISEARTKSEWRESGIFNFHLLYPIALPPLFCFLKRGHHSTKARSSIMTPWLWRTSSTPLRYLVPAWQDGWLCCQESGRELWTADWQRLGSRSRRKCKLLFLTHLTQHLQTPSHTHTPHLTLYPVLSGLHWAMKGGSGGGVGSVLTSCCPLLVGDCNCISPQKHHLSLSILSFKNKNGWMTDQTHIPSSYLMFVCLTKNVN